MDLDYLKASDGTGKAILAHIENDRNIGATVIDVDSVDNFPNKFILTTGTLNASGFIIESTMTEMKCHLLAGDIIIDSFEPGYADVGNTDGQVAIVKQTTGWANLVQQAIQTNTTNLTNLTALVGTVGWTDLGSVPNTIVDNGNRNYTVTINGVDKTGLVSPGTRLRGTRTTAASTYMGGLFNGSSHYFTKATPSGTLGTVTNNITLMATINPTAYNLGIIAGRSDNTPANGFFLRMETDGSILFAGYNATNFRNQATVASVPLNKKTHITATWASGVIQIYFNGVLQNLMTQSTGGTPPTTFATGGDFSIGRSGSFNSQYFTGYIGQVGVFNAVLSNATINTLKNQPLTGGEANCIGAWTLNNVATDATGTNNLTATGGVSYTQHMTPFATNGFGNADGSKEFGIVMTSVFSGGNTVFNVHVPEGCALPTSGTLSKLEYSYDGKPYGMPLTKDRWRIEAINRRQQSNTSPTVNVWYNLSSPNSSGAFPLLVPIGDWEASYEVIIQANGNSPCTFMGTLSTANNSEIDPKWTTYGEMSGVAGSGACNAYKLDGIKCAAATNYYFNTRYITAGPTGIYNRGEMGASVIRVENPYL